MYYYNPELSAHYLLFSHYVSCVFVVTKTLDTDALHHGRCYQNQNVNV